MTDFFKAEHISKQFNKKHILNDVSFSVNQGELLSLIGPSGCGKTTLLRMMIGLETPDSGTMILEGEDITNYHPSKRKMGIVFQNYSLFENMTVLENVAYPLRNKTKMSKQQSIKEALELLDMVQLTDCQKKYPAQLSGGQRQRVAIIRTLALKPDIILFDEPMSALDANIRLTLQKELKALQRKIHTTMVYVTHDVEEAYLLSDRIMVLKDGDIQQLDTPTNIFLNPANDFVKDFVNGHILEKKEALESVVPNV